MTQANRSIWIFGNAVQDITVEVDLDRLAFQDEAIEEQLRIDQGVRLRDDLRLRTQFGNIRFGVALSVARNEAIRDSENFISLVGGKKYTLESAVEELDRNDNKYDDALFVPCEQLSWGGGGINAATFLRALVPDGHVVPIIYSDLAMSRTLPHVVQRLEAILAELNPAAANDGDLNEPVAVYRQAAMRLLDEDPVKANDLTERVAVVSAEYSPDRSLEVYLASLPVTPVLHRPKGVEFRRNWVFSRFRGTDGQVDDKIVCRGKPPAISADAWAGFSALIKQYPANVGAMLLNSLKDEEIFEAAYEYFTGLCREDPSRICVIAMTKSMHEFSLWTDEKRDLRAPLILVFNEDEFLAFAKKFDPDLAPVMTTGASFPHLSNFARASVAIRRRFGATGSFPRMYVTLGSRGSLGVAENGLVVYVSSYTKPRAEIFDTNACGDAYCATVTLMEWAKRNGYADIADVDRGEVLGEQEEMRYCMAVATAAAYCKATNRRGQLYAKELLAMLDEFHLASHILPTVDQSVDGPYPKWIEARKGVISNPPVSRIMGVSEGLQRLLGGRHH